MRKYLDDETIERIRRDVTDANNPAEPSHVRRKRRLRHQYAAPPAKLRWQKGTTRLKNGSYYAEWRETLKSGRRIRRCHKIGKQEELTLNEAREITARLAASDLNPPLMQTYLCRLNLTDAKCDWTSVGAICELTACADLLARGFDVFKSVNPLSRTDLVCYAEGKFYRVEVKSGSISATGEPRCNLTDKDGTFDILAVVTKAGEIAYFDANIETKLSLEDGFVRHLEIRKVVDLLANEQTV